MCSVMYINFPCNSILQCTLMEFNGIRFLIFAKYAILLNCSLYGNKNVFLLTLIALVQHTPSCCQAWDLSTLISCWSGQDLSEIELFCGLREIWDYLGALQEQKNRYKNCYFFIFKFIYCRYTIEAENAGFP